MYTITLLNKKGRVLREYKGMDVSDNIESIIDAIWLGMAAACAAGRIIVMDETTNKVVMNKMYFV